MTYEQYQMMFYIALAACIIFFLLTVILFFVFKIPKVLGDITGLSRKKAIKNINGQAKKMKFFHKDSGQTDKISLSGRIVSDYTGNTAITEKIETERGTGGKETTMLSSNAAETAVIYGNAEETTLLNNFQPGETTLLAEAAPDVSGPAFFARQQITGEKGFAREIQSIVFIHTDEIVG